MPNPPNILKPDVLESALQVRAERQHEIGVHDAVIDIQHEIGIEPVIPCTIALSCCRNVGVFFGSDHRA